MGLITTKILLFLHLFLMEIMHPVHMSLVNIDYLPEDKEFSILFKIYTDDLNQVLYHYYGINIAGNNSASDENIKQLNTYISNNFKIAAGKKNIKPDFTSIRFDDESTWIQYRAEFSKEIEQIYIKNTLLNDLYFDQLNLLIFRYNDFEKGYQLDLNNNE